MKTVGQILKKTRQEKDLKLTDISKITRIHTKYLEALEKDEYWQLPSGATARGFIRNYGAALGLAPDIILSLFRRDFTEDKSGQIIPRAVVTPAAPASFYWTPRYTIITSVVLVLGVLSLYLYREYKILSSPPMVVIDFPKPNAEIKESEIEIKGKTEPDTLLSVNGEKIDLATDGSFVYKVKFSPGENTLTFRALGVRGKTTTLNRTIQVIP